MVWHTPPFLVVVGGGYLPGILQIATELKRRREQEDEEIILAYYALVERGL